jgi:3-oxoacyl-[acyl-carrier protein] reductase
LHGKTALVTGVSRRRGIGYSIARRLLADGASVFISHHAPHDAAQPCGKDDLDVLRNGLRASLTEGATFGDLALDLEDPGAPQRLMDSALDLNGSLDILVCNQARSGSDGSLMDATAAMLDGHYAVNARATVLLTSLFARTFSGLTELPEAAPGEEVPHRNVDEHSTGRVIWLTSGQARPMPGEVAYAMSKAALAGLVPTAAAELARLGILLNAINPGPVNTGYLDADSTDRSGVVLDRIRARMPLGRFGHPDDVARLVAWLVSDEGRWITGQVITSDSGFSL